MFVMLEIQYIDYAGMFPNSDARKRSARIQNRLSDVRGVDDAIPIKKKFWKF